MVERAEERDRRRGGAGAATRSDPARRRPRPSARQPAEAGFRARMGRGRPNVGTGGAFGLSSTRRAATLALVVGALILSVAVPLRTYLTQRDQLREQTAQSVQLRQEVAALEREQGKMSDPAQIEAEARRRLRYIKPGETPYVVQLPAPPPQSVTPQQNQAKPWYESLWESIIGSKK